MIVHSISPRFARAALLAAGVASASPAAALDKPGPGTPYEPPVLTFPENRITLIEAVRLTLKNDPNIKLQEQQSFFQEGVAQTETGRFDTSLLGNASFTLTRSALTQSQIEFERKRRERVQTSIDDLIKTRSDAQQFVTEYQRLQADPTGFRLSNSGEQSQIDLLNTLIRNSTDPEVRAVYVRLRDEIIARGITTNQTVFDEAGVKLAEKRKQLADLGLIPKENQQITGNVDLRLLFPHRDGVTMGFLFNGSFERDRYRGKSKLEDFGGKGIEDVYNYRVGFSLDAALLRGRGLEATGAPEKAAKIDYDASVLALKHAISTSILNTVTAYWNLVAAQEQLDIAKKSAELQSKRVEVTKALIAGDELPRSELARVLASQASDQGLVSSAERAVNEARIALARAIGLGVLEETNAPLAADSFPSAADVKALRATAPAQLIATAVERRYDRQAAIKLQESGGVLLRAAEINLRPRLDFRSQITAGTVAETSLSRTSEGWSAPSFNVTLDFEKPIANNQAKGRFLQSGAILNQRSIAAVDLDRNIKAGVVQALRSLQETVDQVERAKEAVGHYGRTIDAENERFRLGQSSLIDTILTQQLRTSALLTYASARQQYASLLAQLRFETGTLVEEGPEGSAVRKEDLLTVPLLDQSVAPKTKER